MCLAGAHFENTARGNRDTPLTPAHADTRIYTQQIHSPTHTHTQSFLYSFNKCSIYRVNITFTYLSASMLSEQLSQTERLGAREGMSCHLVRLFLDLRKGFLLEPNPNPAPPPSLVFYCPPWLSLRGQDRRSLEVRLRGQDRRSLEVRLRGKVECLALLCHTLQGRIQPVVWG